MQKATIYIIFLVAIALYASCTRDDYVPPASGQTPQEEIIDSIINDSIPIGGEDNDTINDNNDTLEYNNDTIMIGENLLLNGGLEEWMNSVIVQYDTPEHWSLFNNYNVRKNDVTVSEGIYSAKMESLETGSTARVAQRIAVTPGNKIRIRFSYYIEQWKSRGARTYCYFRTRAAEASNISAADLKEFYGQDAYYIIRGGGYGLTYLPHDLNVGQTFDETIEVPPTANYFVFGVNSYHGTIIYVDDCYVIEVSE
jgi:hypothetical protein